MSSGWSSEVHPLDSERILSTLSEQGVRYVVVGGIAAIVHGFSGATFDLDAVPAVTNANLNRLGRALQKLRAVVWADPARSDRFPDGKPPEADDFGYTAEGLRRARVWHLTSAGGLIDIAMTIDGAGGYMELARNALRMEIFGIEVEVASLDDIIASKRAVARPKDLRALPELEALRDQLPDFRVKQTKTQQRRASSGLGLALTKRLVEAHGGGISFAPRAGGGTVFTFTLPIAAKPSEPRSAKPRRRRSGTRV